MRSISTKKRKPRPKCPGGHVGQPNEIAEADPEKFDVPADKRDNSPERILYRDGNCGLLWYQDRGDVPGDSRIKRVGRWKGNGFQPD